MKQTEAGYYYRHDYDFSTLLIFHGSRTHTHTDTHDRFSVGPFLSSFRDSLNCHLTAWYLFESDVFSILTCKTLDYRLLISNFSFLFYIFIYLFDQFRIFTSLSVSIFLFFPSILWKFQLQYIVRCARETSICGQRLCTKPRLPVLLE